MSHDKNLINQIKYKSVKNNPSVRASQEIPYTALDPLITVNDNVLFSIVDQNNAVNNKMTVLQLYDYIRALRTDKILYKAWTVADDDTLTLTEDELNTNQKIIITTEDLSSLSSNFELIIPSAWDDTQGISIEIDYKAFADQNGSYRLRISKGATFGFYYNYFVLTKGNSPFNIGEQNNYKIKFDLLNGQLRNPFGLIGYLSLVGDVPSFLPVANNVGVTYKIKINSVRNTGTIQPSNVTGASQSILETNLGFQPILSIIYSNATSQTVRLTSYEFRCAVKDTDIKINRIETYLVKDDNGNKNALVVAYDTPISTPLGSTIILGTDGYITFSGLELAIYFEGEL